MLIIDKIKSCNDINELRELALSLCDKRKKELGSHPVKCTNDGNEFESIHEACRFYDVRFSNVLNVLRGKYKSTKGYGFEYI